MEVRPYQQTAYTEILKALALEYRTMLTLPTGGGKTIVAKQVVKTFLGEGKHVLFLAHRCELLRQAQTKIGEHEKLSVQSVAGFKHTADYDLIVTDEAHHAPAKTYRAIYDRYPKALHLGLSATPDRLDGSGLSDLFDCIVQPAVVTELVAAGWLAGIKLYVPETQVTPEGLPKANGDYSVKAQSKILITPKIAKQAVAEYKAHADGKRGVVFCVNRAHAKYMCEAYTAAGYKAAYLDGNTKKADRNSIEHRWNAGLIDVVCNCEIYTEGVDLPDVDFVQILRMTASRRLYFQMIGRGMRPGKEQMLLLDHTSNWRELQLPDDDFIYTLKPNEFGQCATPRKAITRKVRSESGEVIDTGEVVEYLPKLVEVDRVALIPKAKAMRLAGDSDRAIGKALGVDKTIIGNWLKDVPRPQEKVDRVALMTKAKAMRLAGDSNAVIGKALGVDKTTIRNWLKDVPRPPDKRSA